jgi:hypothetical protein
MREVERRIFGMARRLSKVGPTPHLPNGMDGRTKGARLFLTNERSGVLLRLTQLPS